jgi:hypothetical protein
VPPLGQRSMFAIGRDTRRGGGRAIARIRRRKLMGESTGRAWSKPELIVLERGGPEEAVLLACKTGAVVTSATGTTGGCALWQGECLECETNAQS